jgi:hypothetical protein
MTWNNINLGSTLQIWILYAYDKLWLENLVYNTKSFDLIHRFYIHLWFLFMPNENIVFNLILYY